MLLAVTSAALSSAAATAAAPAATSAATATDAGDAPTTDADATPPSIHLGVGGEMSLNDPMQTDRGLRLSATADVLPWLSAELVGAWHPNLRNNLVLEYAEPPPLDEVHNLSPVRGRIQLDVDAWLASTSSDALDVRAGLLVGGSLVHTVDIANIAMEAVADPDFAPTRRQWHPAPVVGIAVQARHRWFFTKLQLDGLRYVEQVNSEDRPARALLLGVIEVGWTS